MFTPAFPPLVPASAPVIDEGLSPAAFSLSAVEYRAMSVAVAEIAAEYATLAERDASQAELTAELLRQLLAALLVRIARLPHPGEWNPAAGGEVFRALRDYTAGSIAGNAQLSNGPARVVAGEDIAFVSEDWTFEVTTPDGNREKATGTTANVARRGQDGGWRIAILNPLGTA